MPAKLMVPNICRVFAQMVSLMLFNSLQCKMLRVNLKVLHILWRIQLVHNNSWLHVGLSLIKLLYHTVYHRARHVSCLLKHI